LRGIIKLDLFLKSAIFLVLWVEVSVEIHEFIFCFVIDVNKWSNFDFHVEVFAMSKIFFLFFTVTACEAFLQNSPNETQNGLFKEQPNNNKDPERQVKLSVNAVFKSRFKCLKFVSFSILLLFLFGDWDQTTIGKHQTAEDSMENQPNLDKVG